MKKIIIAIIMLLAITSNALAVQYQPVQDMVKINETTLSSAIGYVEVVIPAGYKVLKISALIITSTTDNFRIIFNNDSTAAHYTWFNANLGTSYSYAGPTSSAFMDFSTSVGTRNNFFTAEIINSASYKKTISASLSDPNVGVISSCATWENTSDEINKIKFYLPTHNFSIGSKFLVYGLK